MNTILKTTTYLGLLIFFLSSCSSSTPEDACNCIKQTANAFMLQGTKPSGIEDLRAPCADLIDKFNEDALGRALITDVATEVLEAIESKTLFAIEGEDFVDFETVEFNNIKDFEEWRDEIIAKDGGDYEVLNKKIVIKKAYFYTRTESIDDCGSGKITDVYVSDLADGQNNLNYGTESFEVVIEDESLLNAIKPSFNISTY